MPALAGSAELDGLIDRKLRYAPPANAYGLNVGHFGLQARKQDPAGVPFPSRCVFVILVLFKSPNACGVYLAGASFSLQVDIVLLLFFIVSYCIFTAFLFLFCLFQYVRTSNVHSPTLYMRCIFFWISLPTFLVLIVAVWLRVPNSQRSVRDMWGGLSSMTWVNACGGVSLRVCAWRLPRLLGSAPQE